MSIHTHSKMCRCLSCMSRGLTSDSQISLDSNYDLEKMNPDEVALHNAFMEKCKPFVPGVTVRTAWGKGVIHRVNNVKDEFFPFHVKMEDDKIRMFKRENLTLNLANTPKPTPVTMQCRLKQEPWGRLRCILNENHTGFCDFGSTVEVTKQPEPSLWFVSFTLGTGGIYALDNKGQIWVMADTTDLTKLRWHKLPMPVIDDVA